MLRRSIHLRRTDPMSLIWCAGCELKNQVEGQLKSTCGVGMGHEHSFSFPDLGHLVLDPSLSHSFMLRDHLAGNASFKLSLFHPHTER